LKDRFEIPHLHIASERIEAELSKRGRGKRALTNKETRHGIGFTPALCRKTARQCSCFSTPRLCRGLHFMKAKRKNISKRVRFAVFSRDGFACRYCGATSEKAQLVLDHVEPVSKGGSNEPENLVTACEPCNAGKADKSVKSAAVNESHRLALAQEMQEQKAALAAAKAATEARNRISQEVCNYYCELR